MQQYSPLLITLLGSLLIAAVLYDYNQHRIPNWVSLSGWLIAPLLYTFDGGLAGLQISIYGFLLVLLLTFPLFLFGWMGAGDVKLMASVGAFVGIDAAFPTLMTIFLVGGVFAVTVHFFHGSLAATGRRYWHMAGLSLAKRGAAYIPPLEAEKGAKIEFPYALPIAVGTAIVLIT